MDAWVKTTQDIRRKQFCIDLHEIPRWSLDDFGEELAEQTPIYGVFMSLCERPYLALSGNVKTKTTQRNWAI